MQSLLTWGIQNSTQGASIDQKKLDPEIIDMILGRPDSQVMKESLAIALDENRSEDDRIDALDQFEMVSRLYLAVNKTNSEIVKLIEQIDNANSALVSTR